MVHSGVVIKRWNREFAFGGHYTPGLSGVYDTAPRKELEGRKFRRELLHGIVFKTDDELDSILNEAKQKFMGTTYDLLKCNCNHFTASLCFELTGRTPPAWLNRAASIGLPFRRVIPRKWTAPPGYADRRRELSEEDEETGGIALLQYQPNQQPAPHLP